MTLDKGAIGETYTIKNIALPNQVEHRLGAIGMAFGGRVTVLGGKDRGTLILKIRGARFALGRGITEKIEVV